MLVDEPLADHFRGFAAVAERDGGTVYPAICRSVADDDEVLSLLDYAPLPQRRPLILLASVHDLLLAGADHPLAAHYDTVASVRGIPFHPPASDVAADFADFCRLHRRELERLIATRTTQTNEVGRCTLAAAGPLPRGRRLPGVDPALAARPGHLGRAEPALRRLRLHLPPGGRRPDRHRRAAPGPPSPSNAGPGATWATCRSCGRPPSRRGSGSTSPPSTRAQRTRPVGCWPASGRRIRPASAACAALWPTSVPRTTRPGSSEATWSTIVGRVAADDRRRRASGRLSLVGRRLPRRRAPARPGRCGRCARRSPTPGAPPLLRDPVRDARPAHPALADHAGGARPVHRAGPHRPGWRRAGPPGRHPPARLLDPLVAERACEAAPLSATRRGPTARRAGRAPPPLRP